MLYKLGRLLQVAGMLLLPVAKWRGYQGKANVYGRSFETLTHGAALAALTKRIAIFSTVHVPLVPGTRALVNTARLKLVSRGGIVLNFARAGIGLDTGPALRLLPHKHGCDGFYAEVLTRDA